MKRLRTIIFTAALAFAACGDGDETETDGTQVVVPPTHQDALAEVKLQREEYRQYYYCDQTYPQVCDDLKTVYGLPREGSEPFRLVFFANQDRSSTWVDFYYVTVDLETKEVVTVGHFAWREVLGEVERKGTAKWGVPE